MSEQDMLSKPTDHDEHYIIYAYIYLYNNPTPECEVNGTDRVL